MKLLHTLSTGLDTLDRNTLLAMWTLSGAFPEIRYRRLGAQWQYRLYRRDPSESWCDLISEITSWSTESFIDSYRATHPEPDLQELQDRIEAN